MARETMIWCLHGSVGMAADWDEFAARMAAFGLQARAVDLWEFVEVEGCSFAEFVEALGSRVRAEDAEPVLLGYSLGGRLALHALLREPSLWNAAVIVSAHPGLTSRKEQILRMAADAEWAARALTADWGEFLAKWNAQTVLRGGGQASLALGDRELLAPRREAVARGFMDWSLGKQIDLRPSLREIDLPLLWVSGQYDQKFSNLAQESLPNSDRVQHLAIHGAGHRVPWEQPKAFAAAVHQFLIKQT